MEQEFEQTRIDTIVRYATIARNCVLLFTVAWIVVGALYVHY